MGPCLRRDDTGNTERLGSIFRSFRDAFKSKFTVRKKRLIHAGFCNRINWREIFLA